MRKLLVVVSALLVLVGVAPVAAAATPPPVGSFETAVTNPVQPTVVMTGWALDRGARSVPTAVRVTVDGTPGAWRAAAVLRADVNRAHSATGGHGFSITLAVRPGGHTVCIDTRLVAKSQVTPLGCIAMTGYRMATSGDVAAIADTLDPHHTIAWKWAALPAGTLGLAQPWNKQVTIASVQTVAHLRDVMTHEWSHVLQYRAFAGSDPWWDAVQAFNALLGHPADRSGYNGIEHGADCIAQALGATYLAYGCTPALRTYGARIARGMLMNALQGTAAATASGKSVTVTGWALDPAAPTTSVVVTVTDNGKAVSTPIRTNLTRSNINLSTGVTGAHGYSVRVSLPQGRHRICVTAQFVRSGKAAATVGNCTTVATA